VTDYVAGAMTGLDPRSILTAAFNGIQFWRAQLKYSHHVTILE